MPPRSIAAVNLLSEEAKREIYARFVPAALGVRFGLRRDLRDPIGRSLLDIRCIPGATDVVLQLRRRVEERDPILYAHLTDTLTGQIHVLLYIVNDPDAPRYDVDRLPDGTSTEFGSSARNLPAEQAAMEAGLAPGQIRRGLRILRQSIEAFEDFVTSLGQDLYFVEPLHYHNAVVFERYGFGYQQGRQKMAVIHDGFGPSGDLARRLDNSTPFRRKEQADSIRGRSWAIHDGILGQPLVQLTMFKQVGRHSRVETAPNAAW